MHHGARPVRRAGDGAGIADVAAQHLDVAAREALGPRERDVVEHADRLAARDQRPHERRADEAAASRHQHGHPLHPGAPARADVTIALRHLLVTSRAGRPAPGPLPSVALTVALGFLVFDAAVHRPYSAFFAGRMWQGKVLFLCIGVPVLRCCASTPSDPPGAGSRCWAPRASPQSG